LNVLHPFHAYTEQDFDKCWTFQNLTDWGPQKLQSFQMQQEVQNYMFGIPVVHLKHGRLVHVLYVSTLSSFIIVSLLRCSHFFIL